MALDAPADAVSDIVVENHRISFTTTAVGMPHLVKVSYFPNWTATGADGPWRATPSLMVVVPPQRAGCARIPGHMGGDGGKIATLIGVLGLIGVGIWGVRRRQA